MGQVTNSYERDTPNGLGNYFECKRFAVQTLLWSQEFMVQVNLEHDTIAVCVLVFKLKYGFHKMNPRGQSENRI